MRPAPPAERRRIDGRPPALAEMWAFRELVAVLAMKELRLRYRHAHLGVLWALLQPAAAAAVFSVVFGRFAGMPSGHLSYPVFALAGAVPWQLFAFVTGQCARCLLVNRSVIKHVYFPRLVYPLSIAAVGIVDTIPGLVLTLALAAVSVPGPGLSWGLVPPWFGLAIVPALGAGVWVAALTVRLRDVHHMLPFVTQLAFVASPVAYPLEIVPPAWRTLYALNPLVAPIEGMRAALSGAGCDGEVVTVSLASGVVLLASGVAYFQRVAADLDDEL